MGQHSGDDDKSAFGDCDDSTALYCSLLESVGIKTALIQLPNHVLMAFDLGTISVKQAQEIGLPTITTGQSTDRLGFRLKQLLSMRVLPLHGRRVSIAPGGEYPG